MKSGTSTKDSAERPAVRSCAPAGKGRQEVSDNEKQKQALCKDLTTEVLCKLRDKSQHSHQGEDRERLKEGGGGDSVSSFQQVKGRRGCLSLTGQE